MRPRAVAPPVCAFSIIAAAWPVASSGQLSARLNVLPVPPPCHLALAGDRSARPTGFLLSRLEKSSEKGDEHETLDQIYSR